MHHRPRQPVTPTAVELARAHPVAHAILLLSTAIVTGLLIGSINIRGVRLGSAGVLFSGIGFAHFGARIDPALADFVKDSGLAIFVFMIGLQLGSGFFGAFRKDGFRLNVLALGVIGIGSTIALLLGRSMGSDPCAVVGGLAGATTNTPSLAAAQQMLTGVASVSADSKALTAMAYAAAYPMGIVGILAAMVILRAVFRIDPAAEAAALDLDRDTSRETVARRTFVVENTGLDGLSISRLPHIKDFGVQISRHRRADGAEVMLAHGDTILRVGDHISAVGTCAELDQFQLLVGRSVAEDLTAVQADLVLNRVVVTRHEAVGKTLGELRLGKRFGVKVTRVSRSGVDVAAFGGLRLQFGDVLSLLGDEQAIRPAAAYLGNSPQALHETHFMPVFLGLALGVLVGLIPLSLPGLPEPVRLGLAGGPLIVALLLSRVGNIGRVIWYVPHSAKLALRELGITLFLACVGLKAGEHFFEVIFSERGARWLALGLAVALIPPLLVGTYARAALKLNYATLCGVLAGSMTDPPALAFANAACRSEAPNLGYATVYPVAMLLRIAVAQIIVLLSIG